MRRSLRWQVLWPVAVALLMGLALALFQATARKQGARRFAETLEIRERLERAIVRLRERHDRSVRRTREALADPRPDRRRALLARVPQHYGRQMERYIEAVQQAIEAARRSDSSSQFEALRRQTGTVAQRVKQVQSALRVVLEAVDAEDPALLMLAEGDLNRADRAMHRALVRAEAVGRQASLWQSRRAAHAELTRIDVLWLGVLAGFPVSLMLAYLPLRRLWRFANAPQATGPHTVEEELVARRVEHLQKKLDASQQTLTERTQAAERASQAARRAEHELALFKLYNENLVNSLRSSIVVTDAAGAVITFNRVARAKLGFTDAHLGHPIAEHSLYAALDGRLTAPKQACQKAVSEREPLRLENLTWSNGSSELILDLAIVPYLDESGAGRGLLWVADDVTEAVETKNQLVAAERLATMGRLSAQVAHEIRNPLSAIGLNTELLEEEFAEHLPQPQRDEALELLHAVGSEVERLTDVTESYLQLTRMPTPNARPTNVNELLADLLAMLNEEMRAHHVEVDATLSAANPNAWVDPGQLRQALLNITRNSREAMPEGGGLHIATATADGAVRVSVSDTGPGIPPDVVNRIFEPFFSTKPDGTGLGLSLTRQMVREHGGHVEVHPNMPRGTTVVLVLPRAQPRAASGDAAAATEAPDSSDAADAVAKPHSAVTAT